MKLRIKQLVASAVIVCAPVMSVMVPGIAHAATLTWTGAGADKNWSTGANWQGGVAPVNGDAVVMNLSATNAGSSVDDIANLNLGGITFTNNLPGGALAAYVSLNANVTLSGPVTVDSSVTTSDVHFSGINAARTITLGTDLVVNQGGLSFSLGSVDYGGDTLNLNGHSLTWNATGPTSSADSLDANITGNGSVSATLPQAKLLTIAGNNTYTGTTQLVSGSFSGNASMFGTSSVSVAKAADVTFSSTTNATISNAIAIAGTGSGSAPTSLAFDGSLASGAVAFTIPNITLNGNTRFSLNAKASSTVNLAGITANGHCIEYLGLAQNGQLDGPSNGFLNGPNYCVFTTAAAAKAPATPNTGFKLIAANPVQTLAVSAVAFMALAGIALKLRASGARR